MAEYRPLPIGVEDFRELIKKNYYYIDKTLFIQELLDKLGKVNLFMRPRRFGKTLVLSMLKYYFEKEYDFSGNLVDNTCLFDGLNIMHTDKSYKEHMGQYPVIFLTLKSAKQPDFQMAYAAMREVIASEFSRHKWVLDSLTEEGEKTKFLAIMNERAEREEYNTALLFLSRCLYKANGKKVIILIDEYDVPLENAYFAGFYDEMIGFIRSLFESALKTNSFLEFAVITGCLRVSKESIFTGLNNLNMISILSELYSEYFGFTQEEVEAALRFYGRESKVETMRQWYDGYKFGNTEVYNPWSVIKYIQDIAENENYFPRPYWANTSSNSIVKNLVEKADISVKEEIERLIDGGTIEKPVHEEVTYGDMDKSDDNLWNFLFFTGYLKKAEEGFEGRDVKLKLAIPNEEVKYIYENVIMDWFREEIKKEDLSALYRAFEEEDCSTAADIIGDNLARTISFYDYAESFYHGFMLGMLSQANYIVKSNREAGNGRCDIVMKTPSRRGLAIVFELKIAATIDELEVACQKGLKQIEDKKYADELYNDGYRNIKRYAIAFYKKDCEVMCGKSAK